MESEYRKGYVYIQKIFAGTIAETEEGYEFSYNEDYLKREDAVSVSLTLPLQKEAYKATVLFPFFDGLIPEERRLSASLPISPTRFVLSQRRFLTVTASSPSSTRFRRNKSWQIPSKLSSLR